MVATTWYVAAEPSVALSVTDAVLPLTVGAKVGTFAPELTRVTWKEGVPTTAVGQL